MAQTTKPLTKFTDVDPRWFQARAICRALKLFIDTGIPANTMYTSTNMRRTAGNITGRRYPAGKRGLTAAYEDLKFMTEVAA